MLSYILLVMGPGRAKGGRRCLALEFRELVDLVRAAERLGNKQAMAFCKRDRIPLRLREVSELMGASNTIAQNSATSSAPDQ